MLAAVVDLPQTGAAGAASAELHKRAEVSSRTPEFMAGEASKPFGWAPAHFVEWATVQRMLAGIGLPPGAVVIDVGCGSGWTSLFLAEAGYEVVGYDLVPANVELARARALRWGSSARFEIGDMERLPAGPPADAALLLDALHHSARQRATLESIAGRLAPGGWLLLGEPTWLHRFSPAARTARQAHGWMERGLGARALRRDLGDAGFGELRRFHQPTSPYEGRGVPFLWQLVRLLAANAWVAPQAHLWFAARRVSSEAAL
jgi:2-polyprenyl-3-methyl-5-hydroxy-6-metoxy-1,4-benzoquinol methylase